MSVAGTDSDDDVAYVDVELPADEATLRRAAYANRCLAEAIDAGAVAPDQLVTYVVARLDDWDAAHPEMARLIREAGEREPTC